MKKGRFFIMRVKLKRVLSFVSAVVICGVSCVTTWFSVPVSAAGGFGWLEWAEFESLLQGVGFSSGGGGYKNVQEATLDWLNMTSDQFYKLTDPTDGGTAKPIWQQSWWGDMTDWLDNVVGSWDEDFDSIADVGAGSSGGNNSGFLFSPDGSSANIDYVSLHGLGSSSSPVYGSDGSYGWIDSFSPDKYVSSDVFAASHKYIVYCSDGLYFLYTNVSNIRYNWTTARSHFWIHFSFSGQGTSTGFAFPGTKRFSNGFGYNLISDNKQVSCFLSVFSAMGINLSMTDLSISDYIKSIDYSTYVPSDNFLGPVYTYPAAQELYKSAGTSAGIRLDVQTQDGVPDIQAALDGAGVKTVDDLVAGVAAGTVPMSKVFSDAKVTPYVVADTATGAVVTDLGVSATATGVKAVGLTQELAVPKDLTNAAAYTIKGKTWDPDMAKYKLPLFQFFPFCLPWDIYEVLTLFDAEPVAPKFTIPVGQFFTRFSGSVDTSKAADQKAVVDLGVDSWQSTFKVIRALECAAIIIGLCLTAVLLIHGGR